jgi:plasmid stability protein
MGHMIQIRNVPSELHRKLKARAAQAGLSLSDYLLRDAQRLADQPTREEMLERLERLTPVHTALSSEDAVRLERDSR